MPMVWILSIDEISGRMSLLQRNIFTAAEIKVDLEALVLLYL